jgi:hypothetical protein
MKIIDNCGMAATLVLWDKEQLKNETTSAGIEVGKNDSIVSIFKNSKEYPQFLLMNDNPEYKRLVEAEFDAHVDTTESLMR